MASSDVVAAAAAAAALFPVVKGGRNYPEIRSLVDSPFYLDSLSEEALKI